MPRSLVLALYFVLALGASEVAMAAWQSGDPTRVQNAYAQAGDPCADSALEDPGADATTACQERPRLLGDLSELAGPIGAKIADQITAAIGAQLQAKKQEALPRLLTRLDEIDLQLQAGLAQTGQLLAATDATLNRTDRVLHDTDDVLDDADDALEDANDTLDDANDVLDESNDALDETQDLLDESEAVLEDTNELLDQSEAALERAQEGLARAEEREEDLRDRIDALLAILPKATSARSTSRRVSTAEATATPTPKQEVDSQKKTEGDAQRSTARPTATPTATATTSPKRSGNDESKTKPSTTTSKQSSTQPKATATPKKEADSQPKERSFQPAKNT